MIRNPSGIRLLNSITECYKTAGKYLSVSQENTSNIKFHNPAKLPTKCDRAEAFSDMEDLKKFTFHTPFLSKLLENIKKRE